jgi:hypothetical protein
MMERLELTRNVPPPKPIRRGVYPYKEMVVGDSFFVPGANRQVVCNNNWRMGKKLGMKFIARVDAGGVRVWRIE